MTDMSIRLPASGIMTAWTRPPRLSSPKNGDLSYSTSPSFTFAMSAEIAFIDFDLSFKGRFQSIMRDNDFPKLMVKQSRCIAIDADNFRSTPRGCARNEVRQKASLGSKYRTAATTCFHMPYQAFIGLPMPAPNSILTLPSEMKAHSDYFRSSMSPSSCHIQPKS